MPGYSKGDKMVKKIFFLIIVLAASWAVSVAAQAGDSKENIIVYQEPGRFAGWPANSGIWSWDNEILVGFKQAYFKKRADHETHSIDPNRPSAAVFARSVDGGKTWNLEVPSVFNDKELKATPCPGKINFAHPDLAIAFVWTRFYVSYDRGKSWEGPWLLPSFDSFDQALTSRTDYIVNSKDECLFFLSTKYVERWGMDRVFCAKTSNGGLTFDMLSWITREPHLGRSVMPSTIRCSEKELVTALRRRLDVNPKGPENKLWIDIYASLDNGETWEYRSHLADTGKRNGNPPSLVKLKDGGLVTIYGCRKPPFGIRAKISGDKGKTWSDEIILRGDGRNWDLGYPRSVVRPDGKIVSVYYFSTKQSPEQFIAATIWDADKVKQ
jgi:hypothetical protein